LLLAFESFLKYTLRNFSNRIRDASLQWLDFLKLRYNQMARCGHLGREEATFTWEANDMADQLREAIGLHKQHVAGA
jgi:S-adenosylmethionine synthetase